MIQLRKKFFCRKGSTAGQGYIRALLNSILLVAVCLLCYVQPVQAAVANTYEAPRTVRVGCSLTTGYHQRDREGNLSGYGYTYEQVLCQYANWRLEYVEGSWGELQEWLAEGKIDMLGFLVQTPERKNRFDFAEIPSGKSTSCLVVPKSRKGYAYKGYSGFGNMRIGWHGNNANRSTFDQYARNHGFSATAIYYDTYGEVFEALDNNSIDAAVVTSFQHLDKYQIIDQLPSTNFYYAVKKGNAELLSELNTALEDTELFYAHLPADIYSKYYDSSNGRAVVFTPEEMSYLATLKAVKVLPNRDKAPYCYYDKGTGEYKGVVTDVLARIGAITGIVFEYIEPQAGSRFAGMEEPNVITPMSNSLEWAIDNGLRNTQPFIRGGFRMLSRNGVTENMSVAVRKGSYLEQLVKRVNPKWQIKNYPNRQACIDAVYAGTCDGVVVGEFEADYLLNQGKYMSWREDVISRQSINWTLGVSAKSDPLLCSVLSKALLMISSEEYNELLRKNVLKNDENYFEGLLYRRPVLAIFLAVLALVLITAVIFLLIYTRIIKRKNKEIEAATQAKSQFLARVSHDIRTPMNTILNLTRMVQEELAGEGDVKQALKDLNKIDTSNRFLLSLINDVLDMSKIEEQGIEMHPERYSYDEFLGYIHSTFDQMAAERGIELTIAKGPVNKDILIDKVRFNQLCFNLISNALKYTPRGGHVSFKMVHGSVVGSKLPCDIYVQDDGIGMSKEFQAKMFEAFSQEDRHFMTVEGTGLGLSIVNEIVERLGGTIKVQSEINRGTVFHIHIDMELAPELEADASGDKAKALDYELLAYKQVLLVEDHPMNQLIAKRLLVKKGMLVTIAENGQQAVEAFEREPGKYAAILMDIRMPIMDGYQATEAIRALPIPEAATIPIIAMTANAYAEDVAKATKLGMNEYLAKPIEPELLYRALLKHCISNKPLN